MTPQERQAKLAEITPEQLAKIEAVKNESPKSVISREWAAISEFGVYFGWQAIVDVYLSGDDLITHNQAMLLLLGARKVQAQRTYDSAIANMASQPGASFKKLMEHYIKEMDSVE